MRLVSFLSTLTQYFLPRVTVDFERAERIGYVDAKIHGKSMHAELQK